MRGASPLALATSLACAAGCSTASGVDAPGWSWSAEDPIGDVRLEHPPHPVIERGTFDLERVSLARRGDGWRLEATFASPVPTLTEVRAARDRVIELLPMTVDVYLDTTPGAGHLAALPGRRFRVVASEAWDRALVASSAPGVFDDDVVLAQRVVAQGRKLVATFARDAVPDRVLGVLVVVLATSTSGEGGVRAVGTGGECRVWDDTRCLLAGEPPPVLDAAQVDIARGRPMRLVYADGLRPIPRATPIVFRRGALLGVAPVSEGEVEAGRLATVLADDGTALATAIVVSVVGDTASLELVSPGSIEDAAVVVFAGADASEVTP